MNDDINDIDARKLQTLEPIDGDDGRHGLIVGTRGTAERTLWYATVAERDADMFKLHDEWKLARAITGARPDSDE